MRSKIALNLLIGFIFIIPCLSNIGLADDPSEPNSVFTSNPIRIDPSSPSTATQAPAPNGSPEDVRRIRQIREEDAIKKGNVTLDDVLGTTNGKNSSKSGLSIDYTNPQYSVTGSGPDTNAMQIAAPVGMIANQVQQVAPKDGAGAAQFTGATTAISSVVSAAQGWVNIGKGNQAGSAAKVYKQAIQQNMGAWAIEKSKLEDPTQAAQAAANQTTIKTEIEKQVAEAAKYNQLKGELRIRGAAEILAGMVLGGNSIANFLAAKELKDGGGTPNDGGDDPFEGEIPVLGPIDLPPDGLIDDGNRGRNPAGFPDQEPPTGDPNAPPAPEKEKADSGSGGGGGSGLSAGDIGKFEEDPAADKLDAKKDKKVDSGAEEKVLGSYDGGSGGVDGGALGADDIQGLLAGLGNGDGMNPDGFDSLLASLMPPEGEENALFGPNLDPNKINEQDIDLFASIKKTHLVFYDEWKKLEEKKKEGKPEKTKIAGSAKGSPTVPPRLRLGAKGRPGDDVKGEKNED